MRKNGLESKWCARGWCAVTVLVLGCVCMFLMVLVFWCVFSVLFVLIFFGVGAKKELRFSKWEVVDLVSVLFVLIFFGVGAKKE